MKIKYGIPTLIEYNSLEENIKLCKELNLNLVEINLTMPYCYPENNDINKLNELRRINNIEFIMNFPQEIDFGTPYQEIQKANLSLFKRYLEYGTEIGVNKINLQLFTGPVITLPNQIIPIYEREYHQYIIRLKKAFEQIARIAYPYQIQVCVENTFSSRLMKLIFLQLKDIDNLFFTYNVGNDAKGNYLLESFFYQYSDKVGLIHLHDYDKENVNQILFRGIINLYDKIEFAKKNNINIIIDIRTAEALKTSVYHLKMRHLI